MKGLCTRCFTCNNLLFEFISQHLRLVTRQSIIKVFHFQIFIISLPEKVFNPPVIKTYIYIFHKQINELETPIPLHNNLKQDRQHTYNVTLWRVRLTIVALETLQSILCVPLSCTANCIKIMTVAQQCICANLCRRQQ